jgi:prolyl-tRNA synthetase
VNHEFMVPSAVGEDHFASCPSCGYAANVEAATRAVPPGPADQGPGPGPLVDHHMPDRPGISDVVAYFDAEGVTAGGFLKSMAVFDSEGRPALLVVPGDREARLPSGWRLFGDEAFEAHPSLVKGYIGPIGQQSNGIRVVADLGVARPGPWVVGANRRDFHLSGAVLDRDFTVDEWGSFAQVVDGDACPRCGEAIELVRSVEAAHTFQLGTRYSEVMTGATVASEEGDDAGFSMGCYGMGVSRLLAVIAEEHHDERGLVWPPEVAPYRVHLVAVGAGRSPDVAAVAERIYGQLVAGSVDVLYDDRDVSPGVKFADADLIGLPVRLVVGAKALARGVVEWRSRSTGEERELDPDGVLGALTAT